MKKGLLSNLISVIFVSTFVFAILAHETLIVSAATFAGNQTVSKNKNWAIKFNLEVQFDDSTKSAITVTDSNGTKANTALTISSDEKTITVFAPANGYIPGDTYELKIDKTILSKYSKKQLGEALTMTFKIEDSNHQCWCLSNKKNHLFMVIDTTKRWFLSNFISNNLTFF